MARFSIAIQPPSQVQVGTWIYPPVVVKQSVRQVDATVYYFGTAVLLDHDGNIADGSLEGTKAANAVQLEASRSSSSTTFVFPFPNLSILHSGMYTIRLDMYAVSADDPTGATLVEQLETRAIAAYDVEVPREKSSSDERAFMRKLKDAGIDLSP